MEQYRKASHCVYDIKYYLTWSTKYKRAVLYGKEAEQLRDIIREICNSVDIRIVKGNIRSDHISMVVSAPPQLSVSKIVGIIKGKSAAKLLSLSDKMRKIMGEHLWATGYFVATCGRESQGRE